VSDFVHLPNVPTLSSTLMNSDRIIPPLLEHDDALLKYRDRSYTVHFLLRLQKFERIGRNFRFHKLEVVLRLRESDLNCHVVN
jgi:hypothetical protein